MKRKKPQQDAVIRRRVLQGLSGVVGAAALGCVQSDATSETTGSGSTTSSGSGGGGGQGGGGTTTGNTGPGGGGGAGGAPVASCTDDGGLTPEQLLAGIDTFVVLCMENRSFDHYLG